MRGLLAGRTKKQKVTRLKIRVPSYRQALKAELGDTFWRPLGSSRGLEIMTEVGRTGPSACRCHLPPSPYPSVSPASLLLLPPLGAARQASGGTSCPASHAVQWCFRFLMTTTKGAQKPPNSKFKNPMMTLQKSNESL